MPSRMAAAVFTLLILVTSARFAYGPEDKPGSRDTPPAKNTTASESKESKEETRPENSTRPVHPSSIPSRKRKTRSHNPHSRSASQTSIAPFTLVSSPPQYLSGEANVT